MPPLGDGGRYFTVFFPQLANPVAVSLAVGLFGP
jgi:hypothetical protein